MDASLVDWWPLGKPATMTPVAGAWEMRQTAAGAHRAPGDLPDDRLWMAAPVPGTVAQALARNGRCTEQALAALDDLDHWYRVRVAGKGPHCLRLHGLATVAEIWLDDARIAETNNMFAAQDIDLTLDGQHTLSICFRSLRRALRGLRGPARWKPRLITPPALRQLRTTLLGHMPGWCSPGGVIGPWRPVELLPKDRECGALQHARVEIDARLEGDDGVVHVHVRGLGAVACGQPPVMQVDGRGAWLEACGEAGEWSGRLRVPGVRKWWPHTHGEPALYAVRLCVAGDAIDIGRVGFRTIEADRSGDGFALRVNGVPVFCRGACLSSLDPLGGEASPEDSRRWLALARDANMNMVRVSGITCYQSEAFYAACDEMGVMVWQDFMFANFDYGEDPATPLMDEARREVCQFLAATRHHPCIAVLCGGSEVEQQAAMMGLPEASRRLPLFDVLIPDCIDAHRPGAVYVGNSPNGGAWPFIPEAGVTHYYGVGAYQRPLDDARRANVRFAVECLAFSNVPCERTVRESVAGAPGHDPRWKGGVPRDAGSGWDFEDVRDFYLRTVFDADPARLRYEDAARYLRLSRAVVAEVMTDVFSEWRRAGSGCAGALVWQLQDMRAGAGWGIVDVHARPKSAWHALRQVWQPVQVLMTDEGLNGIHLHLINETAREQPARVRLQCLRDGESAVIDVSCDVMLAPHSTQRLGAAALCGTFFDFTYAYRFGPPAHDVVRAVLTDIRDGATLNEAFYLPDRRASALMEPELNAHVEQVEGQWWLTVTTRRFARWIHVEDHAFRAEREWFHLAPGETARVRLMDESAQNGLVPVASAAIPMGEVHALNARRPVGYSG